jgi:hypothetical protein
VRVVVINHMLFNLCISFSLTRPSAVPSLRELDMDGNKLEGEIPEWLPDCFPYLVQLETLITMLWFCANLFSLAMLMQSVCDLRRSLISRTTLCVSSLGSVCSAHLAI